MGEGPRYIALREKHLMPTQATLEQQQCIQRQPGESTQGTESLAGPAGGTSQ